MKTTRRIIINADDIGMHPTIDAAVLTLAESGIVTSASVMVLGKLDRISVNAFKELKTDLGLHLDFTSRLANTRYKTSLDVSSMIVSAYCHRMDAAQLRSTIRDQLDRFCTVVGDAPQFIDGHEHVHQLPIVRTAVIEVLEERKLMSKIYFRNPISRHWRGSKAALIGMLGAAKMEKLMTPLGMRCNRDFLGVYNFHKDIDLPRLWQHWLSSVSSDGTLAMCHPAVGNSKTIGDTQSAPFRLKEFKFLSSLRFQELLFEHAITPSGWQSALAPNKNMLIS